MKVGFDQVEEAMTMIVSSPSQLGTKDSSKHLDIDLLQESVSSYGWGHDDDSEDSSVGSDYDSATSWVDDQSLVELEERVQEYSLVGSTPALAALVFDSEQLRNLKNSRKGRRDDGDSVTSGKLSVASEFVLSRNKASSNSLASFGMRRSKSDQFMQKVSNTARTTNNTQGGPDDNCTKPEDRLQEILQETKSTVQEVSEEVLNDFMVPIPMTEETFSAYADIATSVRQGDLAAVIQHVNEGKPLQCCNKFRETILHLVCRRGHENILKYMLEEADVSPCIQDDLGRNPLHELAWADQPNFEMVKAILLRSPDLLYIKDKRGATPLSFVGRNNWEQWIAFLDANRDILAPSVLGEIFL